MAQSFSTKPVANTSLAYYTLTLREPGDLKRVVPKMSYTFPLSPQEIRKTPTSYNSVYDTSGPSANQGVTRQIDLYGQSPPTFDIRGTTGWKLHNTDAYLTSGLTSISRLESILTKFAELNQKQVENKLSDFYTLEFYDYFRNDFWQVVPVGEQRIQQSAQSPLLTFYSLKLVAVQRVSSPIPSILVDLIGNTIGVGVLSAISQANGVMGVLTAAYGIGRLVA